MDAGQRSENRQQEISLISRSLKGLAKELDIPVIACSQLSRMVETRGGEHKRPILADLRESGAIEQDADVVMFVYRPAAYKLSEEEREAIKGTEEENLAEIIVAKQRNGPDRHHQTDLSRRIISALKIVKLSAKMRPIPAHPLRVDL